MGDAARSNDFGKKVLAVLGIDSDRVKSVNIRMDAGDLVTVEVSRFVSFNEASEIVELLESYKAVRNG